MTADPTEPASRARQPKQRPPATKGAKVAGVVIMLAVLGGVAWLITAIVNSGNDSTGPATISGTHTITYTVNVVAGIQQGQVQITWMDPTSHQASTAASASGTWPWVKNLTATNPNGAYVSVDVDNSQDAGASLECMISVDGQTQVSKTIAAGAHDSCELAHI
jgi:hypothetical protein